MPDSFRCMWLFVPVVLASLSCARAEGTMPVFQDTNVGRLEGVGYLGANGSLEYSAFMGIPYAEPPVGPLRFAKPRPIQSAWQGTLNATAYGPICPQGESGDTPWPVSEDCLSLNVFVPAVNESREEKPLAVMVWIHGGGFAVGNSRLDGSQLHIRGRLVVVSLNYRLDILGFFSTGDDAAPGNYGLWDQRLAIGWVRDNIAAFGGDPDGVTLFGGSAGAMSVAMQATSPLNDRSLFQRVILQSGTASVPFTILPEVAAERAKQVGDSLGCDATRGSRALVDCLRSAPVEDLIVYTPADAFYEFSRHYPTFDGDFFREPVLEQQAAGHFAKYDILLGVTSGEGSLAVLTSGVPYPASSTQMTDWMDVTLGVLCKCQNYRGLGDTTKFFYTQGSGTDDPAQNTRTLLEVSGDFLFVAPAARTARLHSAYAQQEASDSTKTFMYYFTHISASDYALLPAELVFGAGHGSDWVFVIGDQRIVGAEGEEAELSETMSAYWTNFAKTGDPNGEGLPTWPLYDPENQTYIILDVDIQTGQRLKADNVAYWNEYFPAALEPSDPNTCPVDVPARGVPVRDPSATETVLISSADGEVLGSVVGAVSVADEAMGGEEVAEFWGIPYARPPLGDLRFRPPEETGPWGDEPLGPADSLPPACPQDVTEDPWMVRLGLNRTSEDCLTLNIYAPANTSTAAAPFPVVVFIHPGFGRAGTSSVYDAVLLASRLQAVVVTVSYRLGALGFLSTEDSEAPGNYGLHDVLAALKWVGVYIGSFRGDAGSVTVLGHGSGAEIAQLLLLSPKANGLFRRALLMGSTAISPAASHQVRPGAAAAEMAAEVAASLGCPATAGSDRMMDCLRQRPAAEFVGLGEGVPVFGGAFPIVVDGDILPDTPMNLLAHGGAINGTSDIILGAAADQHAETSFSFLPEEDAGCPGAEEVRRLIDQVSRLSFDNPEAASLALATEYLGKGGMGDDCRERGSFRRFVQDYLATWSTLESARLHAAAGSSVYVYSFDHQPRAHYDGALPALAGPSRGDDLQYLFGDPYSPLLDDLMLSYSLRDKKTSLELTGFLKNVIYDGEPGVSLSGVRWPEFKADTLQFMALDACPDASSGQALGWDHTLRFWTELMAYLTAPTAQPPPPSTTAEEPVDCSVGEDLGLHLCPDQASRLIKALIGASIGALVVVVFFAGGCLAYRSRALKSERREGPGGGEVPVGSPLGNGSYGVEMVAGHPITDDDIPEGEQNVNEDGEYNVAYEHDEEPF